MKFKVRIFDPVGTRTYTEVLEARDRMALDGILSAQQGVVLSIDDASPSWLRVLSARTKSKADGALICIELGGLLGAGLSVSEALESLAHREDHPGVAIYRLLYERLLDGLPLSEALSQAEGVFPPILIAAVRANERSGRIADALAEYAEYARTQEALRRKVVSAAVYPATVIGFGLLVVVFLMVYVIPKFSAVYEGTAMNVSGPTRLLVAFGQLIHNYGGMLLPSSLFILSLSMYLAIRLGIGVRLIESLARKWPFRELGKRFEQGRICATLAMLTRGGYDFPEAMRLATPLAITIATRGRLDQARERILEGSAVSNALLACGFADGFAARILQAGERTGNLAGGFEMLAQTYQRELDTLLERTMRLVEPVLLMAVASLVGAIVVLMYLPIFDLAGALS